MCFSNQPSFQTSEILALSKIVPEYNISSYSPLLCSGLCPSFDITGVLLQVRFVAAAVICDANLLVCVRVEARRGRIEREGPSFHHVWSPRGTAPREPQVRYSCG